MSNDWRSDDVWQRSIRDRILAPSFYGRYSLDGRYVFVEQGQMLSKAMRRAAVDTHAVSPRTGGMVRIEEKIIRYPRVVARFTNYTLETMSCTVPGQESNGWILYSTADLLLFAFCMNPEETELEIHLLDMPKLKAWFWPVRWDFEPFINDTSNRTMIRKVPFDAVPTELVVWRGPVRAP